MATTITKLYSTGTLLSSVVFDEITYSTIKVGPNGVYAAQFDEVSLSNPNAGSIRFNGSSQYLSLPGTAIPLSGTTFTAECWVYLTGYSLGYFSNSFYNGALLTTTNTSAGSGGNFGFQWTLKGTASSWTGISMYANNGSISYIANFSLSLNTWYHVAMTHTAAGAWNFFINGTSIGTTSNATTWTDNTPYAIGRNNQTGYEYYFPGYISNFRLVSGSVVYTSDFTPSPPLTAISGTSLLLNTTNDANYLKDSSTNNITITANGAPISSSLSPSVTTAERKTSTGTYMVSGYFDEYTFSIFGQQEYTTPGTYSWTAPAGVTSVSVVAIGPGATNAGGGGGLTWANGLSVTPGQSYTVVVGAGGYTGSGSTSSNCASFNWPACIAFGGGSGGGTGGPGGRSQDVSGATSYGGGSGGGWGGGAGGYAGDGGIGYGNNSSLPPADGSGGGGAGGGNQAFPNNGGGGGTGIYGQGSNGIYPGGGGSGGDTSGAGGTASVSGLYGGGGVYGSPNGVGSRGAGGAVRIIWGIDRSFPSTNTGNL
jgi:hypothetical protein